MKKCKFYPLGWIVIVLVMFMMVGCAAFDLQKERTVLGLADWYVTNHGMLKAEYMNATPTHQLWLWENVLPYMNLMKYAIVGANGVLEENADDIAFAADGILQFVQFDYKTGALIQAIEAKDYDAIQREVLVLKNLIIVKWIKHE